VLFPQLNLGISQNKKEEMCLQGFCLFACFVLFFKQLEKVAQAFYTFRNKNSHDGLKLQFKRQQ
jgi:hypothetical protein